MSILEHAFGCPHAPISLVSVPALELLGHRQARVQNKMDFYLKSQLYPVPLVSSPGLCLLYLENGISNNTCLVGCCED